MFKGYSLNIIKGPITLSLSLTTYDLLRGIQFAPRDQPPLYHKNILSPSVIPAPNDTNTNNTESNTTTDTKTTNNSNDTPKE